MILKLIILNRVEYDAVDAVYDMFPIMIVVTLSVFTTYNFNNFYLHS